MGFFSKLNSKEYEKLANRITDLETMIDKLNSKFMSLRGLIHRKATGDLSLEEKEPGENKFDDGFDELRKLNKEHPPG